MVIRKIMDEDFDRFLSNVEKSLPSDKSTLRSANPQNVMGMFLPVCTLSLQSEPYICNLRHKTIMWRLVRVILDSYFFDTSRKCQD